VVTTGGGTSRTTLPTGGMLLVGARVTAPSVPFVRLLAPRWLATRNALRGGRSRALVLAALTAVFWAGCFVFFARVLEYFHGIGDFGPLLTQRLLVLLLVTFFAVLLLSNTVTALTTFYLAGDVNVLLAAPVGRRQLHHARFVETAVSSSWMVLLFGMPAFLAYGVVYGAGPLFYAGTVAALLPFLAIPPAIGVLVATGLVLVFPARRARDALLVLVGVLVALGFLIARLSRPERLADPAGLAGFASFLVGFGAAPSAFLPTTWVVEVLLPLLGAREGEPLFFLAMLYSTAAALFVVSAALVERSFLTAWTRAQEGGASTRGERSLARGLRALARPLPRLPGLLLVKDVTVFLRDASQWSQLLLLLALVVIYVYNFSALPVADGTPLGIVLRDIASFCNLGLAAFVTTAVAVRFVYPVVSLEGRSWWILRTAPVPLGQLWWSKFWIGFLPLILLGEVLVAATNHFLGVGHGLTLVFGLTLVPLIAAVVSLGLAFSAAYPRLDTQNAAQISTGFGAIVYMVTCLGLIALVVAIEAWPVSRMFWQPHASIPLAGGETFAVGLAFACVAALCTAIFALARRRGLRALAHLPV
jgi:ABC-2 type transport system permease protein